MRSIYCMFMCREHPVLCRLGLMTQDVSRLGSPQPQESFTPVLLLSLQLCAPSPASSAISTGLQLGTDAGMSSVLLTMVGSQCGKREPPQQRCFECASPYKKVENTCFSG